MISFLNPSLLWLLPLSLFPVILHLFFRKKPRRVPFSDTRLIQLAMKRVLPRTKLHQWLLLVLRCLALLSLLLIAAKPVGYSGFANGNSRTQQVILLADTSYSMGYTESGITRLNKSKQFEKDLIGDLLSEEGEKAAAGFKQLNIVEFSDYIGRALPEFSIDAGYLRKFVTETALSCRTTNLPAGLSFCYKSFAKMPPGNRAIIIVTDLARHLFPGEAAQFNIKEALPEYDPSVRLMFVSVNNGENDNTCIENVGVMDNPLRFVPEIRNFGARRGRCPVSIDINGRTVANDLLDIPGDAAMTHEFRYGADIRDFASGTAFIQEDNLGADDRYYFAQGPRVSRSVLIVDGDPKYGNTLDSESYYVNTALLEEKLEPGSNRFDTRVVTAEEFARTGLQKYDLVILCNVEKLPQEKLSELSGIPLIVTLGDRVVPDNYPAFLSESIGETEKGEFKIGELDRSGNFVKNPEEFELGNIIFNRRAKLLGGNPLAGFNDGEPLLIEKENSGNKVLIFGSSIDRDWTNFPSKPFYPSFIRSIVRYAVERQRAETEANYLTVGEQIKYVFEKGDKNMSARLILPGGAEENLKAVFTGSYSQAVYEGTDVPGMYRLETGGKTVYFAVNLDMKKSESNLARFDAPGLKKYFPGAPVWIMRADETTPKNISLLLEGKDLTRFFLILVLVLLAAETALSNIKK